MAIAEFLRALFEQADERPIHVAESEEAEVVSVNAVLAQGLKPERFAMLTRR